MPAHLVVCSLSIPEPLGEPLAVLVLLAFVAFGVDMIVHPKRHMKNAWLRRGGEMLREWNELGAQFTGLVISGVSGWLLYDLLQSIWYKGL